MTFITLLHGWGYDAGLWREVVPLLADYTVDTPDLGFFGKNPALATRRAGPCSAPHLAVGHSLGALRWLVAEEAAWDALVIINGFPRFTAADDFPQGVAPRVLTRMQRRFAQTPAEVLSEFQNACGVPGPPLPADTRPLAQGLDFLATADGRTCLAQRLKDIHILASRDDGIVPAALSEAAFAALPAAQMHWCDSGNHALPLTRPQDCAALIRAVAAGLSQR
ncbi:MAG: alpha/beta fold hydrolase [Rugosibacter sp.]|nr:alpha/beta fold hydrolase [Rugosibacter sp.]